MKIALIDDEVDARMTLGSLLLKEDPTYTIQEADGVKTGLELFTTFKPDLVFLDVMMKDGTGFDFLKQLPAIDFKLVIVSGHNEFALEAFRFSAIDYLVKPVDTTELQEALARSRTSNLQPWQQVMEVLKQNMVPAKEERKIVLKDLNAVYVILVSAIIRCESTDNYTTFFLADQSPIIVSRPLKEYEELLTPLQFIRVHQSHLININQLQQFNKREGGSITMKDGSEVPVSTRRREALLTALKKFE